MIFLGVEVLAFVDVARIEVAVSNGVLVGLTFSLELALFLGSEVFVLLKIAVASDFKPFTMEAGFVRTDAIMITNKMRIAAPPINKNKFLFLGFGVGNGPGGLGSSLWGSEIEIRSGTSSGEVLKASHRAESKSWQVEKRAEASFSRARSTTAES